MKNFKEQINELKKTEKGRILIKLSGYMIFFIFVLLLVVISNAKNENPNNYNEPQSNENSQMENDKPVNDEITSLTYLEKQEKLYNSNYKYTYKVTGETEILFTGTYTNNIYEGYKETAKNTIKYKIENGKTYEVKLNEKVEINDLYNGLDKNVFNFKNIFFQLNQTETIINRMENYKTYSYENVNGYNFVVYLTDLEITKIKINNETLNYEFTFEY